MQHLHVSLVNAQSSRFPCWQQLHAVLRVGWGAVSHDHHATPHLQLQAWWRPVCTTRLHGTHKVAKSRVFVSGAESHFDAVLHQGCGVACVSHQLTCCNNAGCVRFTRESLGGGCGEEGARAGMPCDAVRLWVCPACVG
jgi:hypothetical protein